MPIISQFYGIIISMHYRENDRHKLPHLHAEYAEFDAIFDLNGNIIEGKIPNKQEKMIEAWIVIHQDELNALWKLVKNRSGEWFKIEPLK